MAAPRIAENCSSKCSSEDASDNGSSNGKVVISSHNSSESESSFHSEATNEENEVVSYWDRLRSGIMSYPASLQLQCLLYIIGHIFNTSDDNLPINSLGLLPRFIRIKLLHLLPAVDVAKLEDTPVTNGISMNEIWEVIYKERLPLHDKEEIECEIEGKFGTPEDLLDEGVESVTWKEAYFNTVFIFSQLNCGSMRALEDEKCHCWGPYRHFLPDLFYGMDTFHSDPGSSDLYQCFNEDSSLSIHGVYRCAHKCPRLTPLRYYKMFSCPCDPPRREYENNMSFCDIVNHLADCKVSLKHFVISYMHCEEISAHLEEAVFVDCLSKLLTSVEAVSILECENYEMDELLQKTLKILVNIILVRNKCPVKFLKAHGTEFNDVFPFLIEAPQCRLKHLKLSICINNNTSLVEKQSSSIGSLPPDPASSQTSSIVINTALSRSIIDVLEHHQGMQKLDFLLENTCIKNDQLECNDAIQCIADLLLRPTFKELVIENGPFHQEVSFNVVSCLFHNFFSSPYPVSMRLCLNCPQFPAITDSLTVNHDQATNKSLQLINCRISSNLFSLLPRNLVLKSIKLEVDFDFGVLSLLASLESITVDSFSLDINILDDMTTMLTLFRIVNAQEWDLSIYFNNNESIDKFISAVPKVAHLIHHFRLRNYEFPPNTVIPLIESIFHSTNMSSFELSMNCPILDDDLVKAIYDCWKRCSGRKLKKFNVLKSIKEGKPSYVNFLLDMANEVFVGY